MKMERRGGVPGFRFSEAATLALHAMAMAAALEGRRMTTEQAARALRASGAHLSKVLQRLVRCGMLHSVRGPGGGFALGRPADRITLLDVFEAIEGPLLQASCLMGHRVCSGEDCCMLGGLVRNVCDQVRERLAATRLSSVARGGAFESVSAQADRADRPREVRRVRAMRDGVRRGGHRDH